MTTDLDTLLGINTPVNPQEEVDQLAVALIHVRTQLEELKKKEQAIEDAIWVRTPDEVGEEIIDGNQYSFIVSRSEQWKWDSDKIESKLPTVPVPQHVKVKYSIDKKQFVAMSDTEQQDWIDALERKPGSPKVKAVPKAIANT